MQCDPERVELMDNAESVAAQDISLRFYCSQRTARANIHIRDGHPRISYSFEVLAGEMEAPPTNPLHGRPGQE